MYREGSVPWALLGRTAKLFLAIVITLVLRSATAATLTLAWNASTSQNIAGYKVYYGVASHTYTNSLTTSGTSLSISNLLDGQMYYFAATAYDTFGAESDYSSETNFVPLTGRPFNNAPVISVVADQSVVEGTVVGPVTFYVTDVETPANQLTVTATSSDQSFLPNSNIVLGGSGTTRTVTATPVQSSGTAKVTLSVSDGTITVGTAFSVTVTPAPAAPAEPSLTITSSGDGVVTPVVNNSKMVRGKTYTFTAKPGKNQVFAGWTGDIDSKSPKLTVKFDHPINLHANFVPSPFVPVSGKYAGLFYEANGVRQNSAGGFYLMVNTRGMYSGKFQIGRNRYAFAGQLSVDLQGSNTIQRGILPTVAVQFRLGTNDESDQLFGQLTGNDWVANLTGDRAVYSTKTTPAPQAGLYTMILPSQSSGSDAPQGHSFGTIMVNANGTARFAGTMADGTRATVSAPVSKHGTWPMAAMLYTGSGSLISWLTFTNDAVKLSDIQGAVSWIKPSLSNSKLYPSGFTMETEAMGSLYKKPASAQSPVLTFSQGVLDVGGGNYGAENTFDVTLQGSKGFSADNTVKLGFASANGLLRGTIPDPVTGKSLKISGVAFQKQDMAAGMVLGATQSGSVVLSAPAP